MNLRVHHCKWRWCKYCKLWQYRLWSFQGRNTKLERFLAKNQLQSNEIGNQILRIGVMGSCQKLGIILENKPIQKLMSIKFGLSEKHTNFEKIFLMVWRLHIKWADLSKPWRRFFSNLECFSESPNFTKKGAS